MSANRLQRRNQGDKKQSPTLSSRAVPYSSPSPRRRSGVSIPPLLQTNYSAFETPLSSSDAYLDEISLSSLFLTVPYNHSDPIEDDPENEDLLGQLQGSTRKDKKRQPFLGCYVLEMQFIIDLFPYNREGLGRIYDISRNTTYIRKERLENLLRNPWDDLDMARSRIGKDQDKLLRKSTKKPAKVYDRMGQTLGLSGSLTWQQLGVEKGEQMASFVLSTMLCKPYDPNAFEAYIPKECGLKGSTFEDYKASFESYLKNPSYARRTKGCIFESHMLVFLSNLFQPAERYFCEIVIEAQTKVADRTLQKNMAFFIGSNGIHNEISGCTQVNYNGEATYEVYIEDEADLANYETFECWLEFQNEHLRKKQEKMLLCVDQEQLRVLCPQKGDYNNPLLSSYSHIHVLGIPARLAASAPLRTASTSVIKKVLDKSDIEKPQVNTYLICLLEELEEIPKADISMGISAFNSEAFITQTIA